jgi:hypothetical protein
VAKALPQGPGSLRQPANLRRAELLAAVNTELTAFYQGRAGVAEATTKAVQAGNAILSL